MLFLVVGGLFAALYYAPFEFPYKVRTKAMIQPVQEWELSRLPDGSLSSVIRNQLTGAIVSYGITEFRRGDVVRFELLPEVYLKGQVNEGDTIGKLYSNDEMVRLSELRGKVEVFDAELRYYMSGQKPESVQSAEREVELAKQEVENQRRVLERSKVLIRDSLISVQQFEIDEHELEMRKLQVELSEARLQVITSGAKSERIQMIETQKSALEDQILQLEARMDQLTMLAPISGKVVLNRNYLGSDVLVRIIDTTGFVGIAPVLIRDKNYIAAGSGVSLRHQIGRNTEVATGEVVDFNNVAEILNGEAVVFFTSYFKNNPQPLLPGKMVEIEVEGKYLRPWDYAVKLFRSPM